MQIPDPSSFRHRMDVQLRFNDVDVLGHVNNTQYFSYYDMGKAHYFGDVRGKAMDWQRVDRIIANIECSYFAPIVFGEDIEVLTRCRHVGNKSFVILQMLREKNTGQVKSVCETVMVGYDPDTKLSVAISDEMRRQFHDYEGWSDPNGEE